MNSTFYPNIEVTWPAFAWRHSFGFLFCCCSKFLPRESSWSILMVVGYIFKGKCSQKPDLVSQSGSKQNCHFNILYSQHFPPINIPGKLLFWPELRFEIPAKGWICFWKSISFPLRFFWLFSRERLFFGNILLLFLSTTTHQTLTRRHIEIFSFKLTFWLFLDQPNCSSWEEEVRGKWLRGREDGGVFSLCKLPPKNWRPITQYWESRPRIFLPFTCCILWIFLSKFIFLNQLFSVFQAVSYGSTC